MRLCDFSGFEPQLYNVTQFIAVQPKTHYSLFFWVKPKLKSLGTPLIEIINGNDDKMIVSSKPLLQAQMIGKKNSNLQRRKVAKQLLLALLRQMCVSPCPIVGTVWYDDFVLSKYKLTELQSYRVDKVKFLTQTLKLVTLQTRLT